MPRPIKDLTGQKFGRLTALSRIEQPGRSQWRCVCDCGRELIVFALNLMRGNSKSCGCYAKERVREVKTTHGMSYTPTRAIWNQMVQRCTNPNVRNYHRYGGRGISFDPRWAVFENFFADMGERPEGLTLDRYPDNNGDYGPSNCRWASCEQQSNNRRDNVYVEIKGVRMTVAEAMRQTGRPRHYFETGQGRHARVGRRDKEEA